MIKPVLSIIIVSYNTCDITIDCLNSIYQDKGLTFDLHQTDPSSKIPTEIIFIDNNSTDNTLEEVKKLKFPVQVTVNKNNTGFAVGNNQGIALAQGNYILLLNTDTIILHSAISQSLDWLSSHPESVGCTAQLLNKDKTIQASGGFFPNLINVKAWCLGLDDLPFFNSVVKPFHPHTPSFYTHDKFYLTDHAQDWVTGAFLLVRATAINKVNSFDPKYFMYGEEMEMCYRLSQVYGKNKFQYLVGPQVIHLGGASSKNKQTGFDREYEGVIYFFKKHKSPFQYQAVLFLIKINRFLRLTVYRLLQHA